MAQACLSQNLSAGSAHPPNQPTTTVETTQVAFRLVPDPYYSDVDFISSSDHDDGSCTDLPWWPSPTFKLSNPHLQELTDPPSINAYTTSSSPTAWAYRYMLFEASHFNVDTRS
jgi:hypothetical protein